jgi:hypothetical protein
MSLMQNGLVKKKQIIKKPATYKGLTPVLQRIQVFWDVMLCNWVHGLHKHLKKALRSFKMLGITHPVTQHDVLEDLNPESSSKKKTYFHCDRKLG